MRYAPMFGPWSVTSDDDASALDETQGSPYPLDWMTAQATPSAAAPFGSQFAPSPLPSPTAPTLPGSAAAAPSDAGASLATLAAPPGTSDGLPYWLAAALTPAATAPLAPLVTPEWASTFSLLGRVGQLSPFRQDGPPLDMSMSLFPRPPGAAKELPPRKSVLYNQLTAARPDLFPLGQDPDPDSDQATRDLVALGLPVSKSDTPFFPPPPEPSIVRPRLMRSWLDIASSVAPGIVDYFTKPIPPLPPFTSTPGKIPSWSYNPYTGPALQEAVSLGTAAASAIGGVFALARSAGMAAAEAGTASGRFLSAAERLAAARRAQLEINKAASRAFEAKTQEGLANDGIPFAPQITIQTTSGKARVDFVTFDPVAAKFKCLECKASETAPLTKNQMVVYPEIEREGGIIVGKGKPGFPGGTRIPPTQVEIRRPPKE